MLINNNAIPIRKRMKELLFDYLVILLYLVLLFGIAMSIYMCLFKGIPQMNELQAQLIAILTSVIPIILIFSYLDYSKDGSLGKSKSGLILVYKKKSIEASLIRNCIKFFPWQLGHISTIHGIYTNFDSLSIVLSIISMTFGLLLLLMALLRQDKRHLGDLLANTQVQLNGK
ncbi:RDD family protein [Facklamia miroungae]|uniref:RDD family protein n=1 Tax=Facklamia miroungae TaxID=120956 RepID=A0A1G7RFR6_9LACT|nr:RDD family protein [Facklamia miroungae]NKZ29448.1 RDD family protein [Facklamia miroungae]SDG08979.1 RDD family protein [Facklamia miroungae]